MHSEAPTASPVDAANRIRSTGLFTIDDVELISAVYLKHGTTVGTPWDDFRDTHMALPAWYRTDLDPISIAYLEQQKRLWRAIVGVEREYDPRRDELTKLPRVDPVRQPAYFQRRDPRAVSVASGHVIATGMILKHSGLRPGKFALEYGAGFAQTALMLARLGVHVDTVDISPEFCGYVREQAEFFGVELCPFEGEFGLNPRGDRKYDLIFFYESFHHCLNFLELIDSLKKHLAPDGRVLMAGEPIMPDECPAVPYPWGLRLDSENLAIVRYRGWFELGFTEDFVASVFTTRGFAFMHHDCPVSTYGNTWEFTPRPQRLRLSELRMSKADGETWHLPEATGRWTRSRSQLTLDTLGVFEELVIHVVNHHPVSQTVTITYGGKKIVVDIPCGPKALKIDASVKSPQLVIESPTFVPANYRVDSRINGPRGNPAAVVGQATPGGSTDRRELGIYVESLSYE